MAKARARSTDGTFIADNPDTPENEAWVEVPSGEVAPRVFGWVAGRTASRQIHPDTNPEVPA
jgi:hypothetical protein